MKNISQKTVKMNYQLFQQMKICCICGLTNCQQAYDHEKTTLSDFIQTINEKRSNESQIQRVKTSINHFYRALKNNIVKLLEKDRYEILTYVNKFYFPKQFCQKNRTDVNMICQIMEKNIEKLPTKKIGKLIKKIQNVPQQQFDCTEINTLNQKVKTLISQPNLNTIMQSLKEFLPSKNFKDQLPDLQLKRKKTSISDSLNPQQENNTQKQKIYEWRNVKVTKNSRTVSLSNKNISDLQVMEQVPILANYKNLKEFEIRNNKISCLSCNLIVNNLPFLLTVDIRGNLITDKGIIKLVRGIPKLKSFFISQTLASDQSGQEIIKILDDLEILWSEHTKLSNQVALRIASKPKLKVLSLVGNPIDDEYKEKMKKIFISKGYISI